MDPSDFQCSPNHPQASACGENDRITPKAATGRDAAASRDALAQIILSHFPGGICVYNADLKMVAVNEQLKTLLDYPRSLFEPELPHMSDVFRFNAARGEYGAGDVDDMVAQRIEKARAKQAHVYRRVRPNGLALEVRGAPLEDGGFVTTYLDVTEEHQRRNQLEALLKNYPGGICLYDRDHKLVLWNEQLKTLLEYPDELLARTDLTLEDLFHFNATRGEYGAGDVDDLVRERIYRASKQEPHEYDRERPNGVILNVCGVPVDGGFLTTYHDVTDRRRDQAMIKHLALHDTLTDLPNRLLLNDRLSAAFAHLERCALIYVDLDKFKPINDTYGHAIGDRVLSEAAQRMKATVAASDTVARVGGDEFVVLQCEIASVHDAEDLAKRLNAALAAPFYIEGHKLNVSASIGIAAAPECGTDQDTLMSNADKALYAAKSAGRNTYRMCAMVQEAEGPTCAYDDDGQHRSAQSI